MENLPVGWFPEFETEGDMDSFFDDTIPQQEDEVLSSYPTFTAFSDINTIYSSLGRNERPNNQLKDTTEETVANTGKGKKRGTRTPCTQEEHVIAERTRREKLTRQIISLSAIVPGLKRTDKISVLGDTAKYIKHMQERLKTLEEKNSTGSAVFVKRFRVSSDSDSDFSHVPLPVIDARASNRNVMIRIHCENHIGVAAQILLDTEKLDLSVLSSIVMPFGSSTFDMTLIAQMDTTFNMIINDLVKEVRSSIVNFMKKNRNV